MYYIPLILVIFPRFMPTFTASSHGKTHRAIPGPAARPGWRRSWWRRRAAGAVDQAMATFLALLPGPKSMGFTLHTWCIYIIYI